MHAKFCSENLEEGDYLEDEIDLRREVRKRGLG
jgi:hypothetical protein